MAFTPLPRQCGASHRRRPSRQAVRLTVKSGRKPVHPSRTHITCVTLGFPIAPRALMPQSKSQSKTYVFDAYGTLFDVHAAASTEQSAIGANWEKLSQTWRSKHLEYTWIHAITGRDASFWVLCERSLDYAIAVSGGVPAGVRERLLQSYRNMRAFPEVVAVLTALRARGANLAILSNGDPDMLADAVNSAGLAGTFDAVLSVRDAGIFKPDMSVYRLVVDRFGGTADDVSFQSSNRWDIAGACAFGFRTVWVNRVNAPDEYPDMAADRVVHNLTALVEAA